MHILHSQGQRLWVGNLASQLLQSQAIQFMQPAAPPTIHRTLLLAVSPGEHREWNMNSFWGLAQTPEWGAGQCLLPKCRQKVLWALPRDLCRLGSQATLEPTASRMWLWTWGYRTWEMQQIRSQSPFTHTPQNQPLGGSAHQA